MNRLVRPELQDPAALRQPILRYLTEKKFVSLVSTRALWFSTLRALEKEDPSEGLMPVITKRRLESEHRRWEATFPGPEDREQLRAMASRNERDGRDLLAVCCWSVGPESMAMWRSYVNSTEGVVIESSAELLRDHIAHQEYDRIGLVRYVDFEQYDLGSYRGSQAEERAFLKRPEFAFEQELRAVTMNFVTPSCLNENGTPPTASQLNGPGMYDPTRKGFFVRARVSKLVRVVRLAPGATAAFSARVQRAAESLGLKVERSSL